MPLLKTILKSFKPINFLRPQSLEVKIVGIHLLVANYFYIYGSKSYRFSVCFEGI